ncbi:MAG: CRISPR locus-related DNA-binding protein [Candidatus Korarchaeota archaeon]|nr:CRISPR locus-related DNA-binding protein [Candidatus Korarchaeota archaeon]
MSMVLILTLGFDERFCYRALLRHDVREGDRILIFTGKLVERTEKAYKMIEEFIRKSYGNRVAVDLVELDPTNPIRSIELVIRTLKSLPDVKWIVNLSGGMRFVVLTVIFSLLMIRKGNIQLEVETEDLSGLVTIPPAILTLVTQGMTKEKVRVLEMISGGLTDVKSIASKLGKSRSTVRKQLQHMQELGLVRVRRRKPLEVEVTELGRLVLELEEVL